MKKIVTLAIILFTLKTFGQKYSDVIGQQMTSEKWNEEAKTNIRLLPKYGHVLKSEPQKQADGTYFFAQYIFLHPASEKDALRNLEVAITYLKKSYQLDPKDQNTTFKLSACYLYKSDCDNAWKFYSECKMLGGQPITEDYTSTLIQECKKKK